MDGDGCHATSLSHFSEYIRPRDRRSIFGESRIMTPRFEDYSGAAPILLSQNVLRHWQGFFLPTQNLSPDLEVDGQAYRICSDFDFENPKTDYDRACAAIGAKAFALIPVGKGQGMVIGTTLDSLGWWEEERMVINGGRLPDLAKLKQVEWERELVWITEDSEFVLLNACDHGGAGRKPDWFEVRLDPGTYGLEHGTYGWKDDEACLSLFRFVQLTSC